MGRKEEEWSVTLETKANAGSHTSETLRARLITSSADAKGSVCVNHLNHLDLVQLLAFLTKSLFSNYCSYTKAIELIKLASQQTESETENPIRSGHIRSSLI